MKDETFLDRLFTRADQEKVLELSESGLSPKQIQENMMVSLDFINETIEADRFAERANQDQQRVYEVGLL